MTVVSVVRAAGVLLLVGVVALVALVAARGGSAPEPGAAEPVAASVHPPRDRVDVATRSTGPDDGRARVRGTVRWWNRGGMTFDARVDDVCPRDDRRASVYVLVQNPNGPIDSREAVDGPRCADGTTRVRFYNGASADLVSVQVCEVAPGGRQGPCRTRDYRR